MDVGTAMSVVQTLLASLQCSELERLCSIAGYKLQLQELQGTVKIVKAVLQDAEQKQVLSTQEEEYIESLKDVVDEADNLFDEFVTRVERKKLRESSSKDDGILSRIRCGLSSVFSKCGLAYTMSHKAKEIKAKLDNVAYNKQFSFKHNPEQICKRSRETCSYEHEQIIGREDDLQVVMDMLWKPNVERNVSFLSVVGIGGLGKTALAQLVYDDPRVEKAFSLRMWACVSDEGQKALDVTGILCKILGRNKEGSTLEQVQQELRNKLQGEKYLLVLDDVWTESRNQWSDLEGHLMGGESGSRILVTTRSIKTARLLKDGRMHTLSGLSQKNSWLLLKRKAFGSEESSPPEELVEIGQTIVKKCAYVPLAIRVVGSLLYGEDLSQWQSFQELGLANINEKDDDIKPILKISYYQLPYQLKSCIRYCSLFPKDEVIQAKKLIQLWMAQGYLTGTDQKSMEEVGEEYVLILIDRGFFQDVKEEDDNFEIIKSFKIHDLIYDVMDEVVGKEICRVNSINGEEGNKVRHISLEPRKSKKLFFPYKTHVRSFLLIGHRVHMEQACVDAVVANLKYLRTLDLSDLGLRSLPGSIGKLLHLRYLDLSSNTDLELLPRQITRLYNLLVLDLFSCIRLKELPKDMSRLTKLRVLDTSHCGITHMPKGIGELTCLHTVTRFVVGEASTSKELLDAMEDLKGLVNLKGKLEIFFRLSKKGVEFGEDNGTAGGYLVNKEHLDSVTFWFVGEVTEWLMDELQPHHNLKNLEMECYQGTKMPRWATVAFLPNLVRVSLSRCKELKTLKCLGNLGHLEELSLDILENLEYLNEKGSSNTQRFSFFPSLKVLFLGTCQKLKGWEEDNDELRCLPKLRNLDINNCPNLIASLQCPQLEFLSLTTFNNGLQILTGREMNKELGDIKGKGKEAIISKLKELSITDVEWLKLVSIGVNRDKEVESFGDVFHICSSSLQYLDIIRCKNLTSVSGVSEHLVTLEVLVIESCPNLSLSLEREDGSDMRWPSFVPLRCLILEQLPQLVNLPNWIQHLTALESLRIRSCTQLESLPNWMSKLTSLRNLKIVECSATLEERCRARTCQDWPLIAHIPSVYITSNRW